MGRAPCCDKANVKRGPWSPDEDDALTNYLQKYGTGGNWIALPRKAGLKRCGKSCRLRWLNYLRPDIKHGGFTDEEDNIICSVYNSIGSRWSIIAAQLPGRTDNDVKNHWNTKLKKRLLSGKTRLDPNSTDSPISSVPVEAETLGYLNGNDTTTPFSYMAEMKHQQNHDYSGLVLDQIDQFPLPGLMDYSTTTSTAASNNYSVSSSQDVSSFFTPSFFSLEDYSTAWTGNGGAEDQRILPDQLDFQAPHFLFTDSNQMYMNPNSLSHPK